MERQNSSKEQIRQLLRDAICVLCKNVIAHSVQMKIEALIGITIDSEADVVLININEMFDKSISEAHNIKIDSSAYDAVQVQDCEKRDGTDTSYSMAVQEPSLVLAKYQPEKKSSKPRVVVKTEQFSSSVGECSVYKSPEYGQQYAEFNQLQQSQMTQSNTSLNTKVYRQSDNSGYDETHGSQLEISGETADQWQNYEDNLEAAEYVNASSVNDYEEPYEQESYEQYSDETQYNQYMPDYSTPPKRQRASNKPNTAQRKPRGKPSNAAAAVNSGVGGSEGNNWKQLDADEVSHVTIFTCSRCGAQLKNKQSFLRHKRSHEGIVYRCDGCGKILSRADHLNAHRRKCPAALQQEPLNGLYSA